MVRSYVKFNMPLDAYKMLCIKQAKMVQTIKDITGKDVKIPRTKVISKLLQKPIWLEHDEVILMGRKRYKI